MDRNHIHTGSNKGFTLIELLVVISIIGVLASVVLASLNSARMKARNAVRLHDLRQIELALTMYYDDHGSYPSSLGGTGGWDGKYSCWGDDTDNWINGLAPTYIPSLPRDPRENTVCDEQYFYRSDGRDYKLLTHKPENSTNPPADSIIDPARDGGSDSCDVDGSGVWAWGVYTAGARCW